MVSSFENKLKNSSFSEKKDYFVSDEGHEGKVYTIVSHQLKKTLCEVINPLLRINEWEAKEEEFIVKIEDYYRKGGSKITNDRWLSDEEAKAMKARDMEKADNSIQDNYDGWTREQFIVEINRLKTENKWLKGEQTLTSSERQQRLELNQRELERLESFVSLQSTNETRNNSLTTPLLVGGGILAVISTVVSFLVYKRSKQNKIQEKGFTLEK